MFDKTFLRKVNTNKIIFSSASIHNLSSIKNDLKLLYNATNHNKINYMIQSLKYNIALYIDLKWNNILNQYYTEASDKLKYVR